MMGSRGPLLYYNISLQHQGLVEDYRKPVSIQYSTVQCSTVQYSTVTILKYDVTAEHQPEPDQPGQSRHLGQGGQQHGAGELGIRNTKH